MATKIIVPILGESITEAELVNWLKKVGDPVRRGDELVDLETAKATMPLECPANGELLAVYVSEGEMVVPGQLLAVVGKPGEEVGVEVDGTEKPSNKEDEDAPHVTSPSVSSERERSGGSNSFGERRRVSPAARRLARELGIEISLVKPSQCNLRITTEDVRTFAISETSKGTPYRRVKLTSIQKTMAERMSVSAQQIPQFSISMDADAGCLLIARSEMNRKLSIDAGKISITALFINLLGDVLMKHPVLNARFDGDGLIIYDTVNVAVAVSTPKGLVVPVVRGVERLSLEETALRLDDLAERGRNGRLESSDMNDGTITISNLGMYGVADFIPLVNPPQAAIIGLGAVRPVVLPTPGGGTSHHHMIKMTLSADHRVIDGASAAEFLSALRDTIEDY